MTAQKAPGAVRARSPLSMTIAVLLAASRPATLSPTSIAASAWALGRNSSPLKMTDREDTVARLGASGRLRTVASAAPTPRKRQVRGGVSEASSLRRRPTRGEADSDSAEAATESRRSEGAHLCRARRRRLGGPGLATGGLAKRRHPAKRIQRAPGEVRDPRHRVATAPPRVSRGFSL